MQLKTQERINRICQLVRPIGDFSRSRLAVLRTITDLSAECRRLNKWLSKTKADRLPGLSGNYRCRRFWPSCLPRYSTPSSLCFDSETRNAARVLRNWPASEMSDRLQILRNRFHVVFENCQALPSRIIRVIRIIRIRLTTFPRYLGSLACSEGIV